MDTGKTSIVYSNIHLYRVVLNLLYAGTYRSRFEDVTRHLSGRVSVLELCFGDIWVAKYCRERGIAWTGFDINESFVRSACKKGYNAFCTDVSSMDALPKNDITVIQGSLYHFHEEMSSLLAKIFASTDALLVSEPVRNISSSGGAIGWLARRSADAGKGHEHFRYDADSLQALAAKQAPKFGCSYSVVGRKRDMTILFERPGN